VGGVHLAVLVGAALALCSAVIVFRYLPHSLVAGGPMHGPVASLDEAAELGLGGVPPHFGDDLDDQQRESLADHEGAQQPAAS